MKKFLLTLIASTFAFPLMGMENVITVALKQQQNEEQKSEHLNANDIETFSQQPFYELIEEAHANGTAYALARVQTHDDKAKTAANQNPIHYFDQRKLYRYLKGKHPGDLKPCNEYENPVNRFPIQDIDYFAISVAAKVATYSHSYADILKEQTERRQRELLRTQNPPAIAHSSDSAPQAPTMANSESTALIINAAVPGRQFDPLNCCNLKDCCDRTFKLCTYDNCFTCVTASFIIPIVCGVNTIACPFACLKDTICLPCDRNENKPECYPYTNKALHCDLCMKV